MQNQIDDHLQRAQLDLQTAEAAVVDAVVRKDDHALRDALSRRREASGWLADLAFLGSKVAGAVRGAEDAAKREAEQKRRQHLSALDQRVKAAERFSGAVAQLGKAWAELKDSAAAVAEHAPTDPLAPLGALVGRAELEIGGVAAELGRQPLGVPPSTIADVARYEFAAVKANA